MYSHNFSLIRLRHRRQGEPFTTDLWLPRQSRRGKPPAKFVLKHSNGPLEPLSPAQHVTLFHLLLFRGPLTQTTGTSCALLQALCQGKARGAWPAVIPSTASGEERPRRRHCPGFRRGTDRSQNTRQADKKQGSRLAFQISGNTTVSVPHHFDISCSPAHWEV